MLHLQAQAAIFAKPGCSCDSLRAAKFLCRLSAWVYEGKLYTNYTKIGLTLLVTLKCWTNIVEEGVGLDVIYLDYKKAFDTVSHQILLQKLRRLQLGDALTKWIEQFLLGRQMRIHVNGSFSSLIDVISGVPQGSVLGQLFFFIFVNDLSDWVKGSILMFADDTKLD